VPETFQFQAPPSSTPLPDVGEARRSYPITRPWRKSGERPGSAETCRSAGATASFSAIDLLRSVMLSQALRDGSKTICSRFGYRFEPGERLRLLARPEAVVAGVYIAEKTAAITRGVRKVLTSLVPGGAGAVTPLTVCVGPVFLRIKAGVLRQLIEDSSCRSVIFARPRASILSSCRVRLRRTRRTRYLRGLQLFATACARWNHADGGTRRSVLPLWKVRF